MSALPIVPSAPADKDAVKLLLTCVKVKPDAAVPQLVPPGWCAVHQTYLDLSLITFL